MVNHDDCDFCTIIAGDDPKVREVYRNEHVVAFHPTEPATRGHVLIVPRRHVEAIWQLRSDEATQLAQASLLLSDAIRDAMHPDGLNVIQSNGEKATQTVPHLHVHIVPRYEEDGMGEIWPPETAFSEQEKSQTQRAISDAVRDSPRSLEVAASPEDRRKHLDLIQSVIARQSSASAATKSWLLPVTTATFGFALTQQSWPLGLIGVIVIVLFAMLDVGYLKSERLFRKLYQEVIKPGSRVPLFSLDPTYAADAADDSEKPRWRRGPDWSVWMSWSILPFYFALVVVGIVVIIASASGNDGQQIEETPSTVHVLLGWLDS